MQRNSKHGGAREGAGRKRLGSSPAVKVNCTVRQDQTEKFKRLGGSKWLQAQIDAAEEKT